jgi:hypothetical protein
VDAVRVVGNNGHVEEVHVLAIPGKPAKQVVRDVQSLAMAAYGLAVDRRVISVVQIQNDQITQVHRPSILDISETPNGNFVEISVSLGWHSEVFRGASTGPMSSETRPRLVGEATLKALEQALNGDVTLALSNIENVTVGPRTICLSVVVMVTNGEERTLIGSAMVGTDPAQAAVRSVLDGVNRQVPNLSR